jgi:dihydroorotate dehydrogenase (NAD+) catalytic subunit
MGGIATGNDALEFILAGADAVSVGTAVFHDPAAVARVGLELADLLQARGFTALREAVSYAHRV